MLHNKALEGLVKTDRVGYDLYSSIADTKANFLKYCKPFERRIRTLVPDHRVVPAGDGEASTTVSVLGFLVDAKAKKKTFAPQKIDLQFLEHHKSLYLELHRDFTKSGYAPQTEASLQNFKTLLMLEITILLGCDIEWATGSTGGAAITDPPVLASGAAADDGDASDSQDSDAQVPAGSPAAGADPKDSCDAADEGGTGRGGAAADNGGDAGGRGGRGGAAADRGGDAGGGAAALDGDVDIDTDRVVLDMGDFTTWQPQTWDKVDYDKIQFPTDPMLSICSVRPYFAVAIILWYNTALREKHARTWDSLTAAWKATFHHDLSSRDLDRWPEDGPHAFTKAESAWLSGTLRFLKLGAGRPASTRRRSVPPVDPVLPPPPAKPAPRDSSKAQRCQGASTKTRDADPVRSASRFLH